MKAAVIVLSDPKNGKEALGRLFNALAVAYDFKHNGDEVTIQFQGTGTLWLSELTQPDHPVASLYAAVVDTVAGVSCGCAEVFGAEVESSGLALLKDNPVPGTPGLPSLRRLLAEGYQVLTF
ncbi:DsrE family protein [Candidatus Cyanaurora vandensis]|uniref:DsrE family protein n=1 Tax=Candidatus Cyanaurora vandensis TaxID=2714958 RepID=UPI002580AF94|nr:DsrE family protein [Candidatus Cyanaurora vandensis]